MAVTRLVFFLQAEEQAGAKNAASPQSVPPSPAAADFAKDVNQDGFVEPEKLVRIIKRAVTHKVAVLEMTMVETTLVSYLQAEQQAEASHAASPPSPSTSPVADHSAEDVHQDAFVELEKLVRIVTSGFTNGGWCT